MSLDDVAEQELAKAKLPTIFSYRRAFVLGYEYHKHQAAIEAAEAEFDNALEEQEGG